MTISIVQTVANYASGNSGITVSITCTAGNTLHVYGAWNTLPLNPTFSLTDDQNTAVPYCPLGSIDDGTQKLVHWYHENVAGGATTISLDLVEISDLIGIYVEEIHSDSPMGLVGRSANFQSSPGTGTDAVTSGAATLLNGSLLTCAVSFNTFLSTPPDAGTGFTSDATNPTWLGGPARQESFVGNAGASAAATFTATAGPRPHLTVMAVFGEVAASATGGYISSDDTHIIHTFVASDTFTPSLSLTVDSLVVAGGGAGGSDPARGEGGGGGGAGGVLYTTESAVTPQGYTITIGSGGASTTTTGGTGNNGGDSSISVLAITATGGGGGANTKVSAGNNGANGGSGGGGATFGALDATGGTGIAGQGYAGGNCDSQGETIFVGGGGGGGAGAVGGTAPSMDTSGDGGTGVSNSISGFATYYGGGGGGSSDGTSGAGGAGGGGYGGSSGYFAEANTGGGGGASGGDGVTTAGDGGSGIIIIRYLAAAVIGSAVDVTGTWNGMIDGDICFSGTWNQVVELDVCVGGVWNKQVP